jgi:hypothetical protein
MIQLRMKYHTTFSECGVPMGQVRLTKMCFNVMYSKVHIGKHNSPIQNDLKQGNALSPLLPNFALEQ